MHVRDQLAAAKHPVEETELIFTIMVGLPEPYHALTTVLSNSDQELVLSEVVAKLLTVEQRGVDEHEFQSQAMATQGCAATASPAGAFYLATARAARRCVYCDQPGHNERQRLRKKRDKKASSHGAQRHMGNFALRFKHAAALKCSGSGCSRHESCHGMQTGFET